MGSGRRAVVLACALAVGGCGSSKQASSQGGTTPTGAGTPPAQPAAPTPPTSVGDWTFYGAGQGLPAQVYDVSADEGGNVYVAGGDGVYAKPSAAAARAAGAVDAFKRFDASNAGITQNCFQGLDPWTATGADLYRVAHPNPPGPPAMCPIISVAGAAAGKAIIGFNGYGTDGDLDGEWAKDSSGLDVLAYDPVAAKVTRTRHVYVATAPGIVCGAFEQPGSGSTKPVCFGWDEFMLYGRRKLHKVYRIVVNHHAGTPQYGDVWMGGTHATLSAFFNDQAEARGWYGNAWIRDCATAPGADPTVCPKFQDPVTGAWNVFEHEHPAFNTTPFPNDPTIPIGPDKTGDTWALAIAPNGQPWAHNGLRLAAMHGDTADLGAGVRMDWKLVFDLWPDTPTTFDDDAVRTMTFCPDGTLWVGTLAHGLARVNTTNGSISGLALPAGTGQNVWALACDRNGSLWISTDWAQIVRYDTKAGSFSTPPADLPSLAHHVAASIQIDEWSQPNPVVYFAMQSLKEEPGGVVSYSGP